MNLGSVTLGVMDGLVVGVLAVGIVLVYRSDRFLNLAHGQLGAVSALLLGKFVVDFGVSYWVALPLALGVGVVVGVGVNRLFVRRLQAKTSSTVALLLLSVGVGQILQALVYVKALGPSPLRLYRFGYPLPFHSRWKFAGVFFGTEHILILVLCPLLVVGLAFVLRATLIGKMIRAAAGNRDEARLSGISPALTSAVTWGMAGGLSAMGAILLAPSASGGFDPALLGPEQLFLALGAAAFGAFTSIPAALVGGLTIGLATQLTIGVTANAGTAQLVVFVLVLGVIFVRGRALSQLVVHEGGAADDLAPVRIAAAVRDRFIVANGRRVAVVAALAVAAVLPLLPVFHTQGNRFLLGFVLIYALIGVSVTMVTGWGGQLSLGHFAVVGIGAYLAARLSNHGLSILFLFVIAGGVGAATLVFVSLPALRVRGFTLAVTTLGFGVVAAEWLFRSTWFTASISSERQVNALPLLRGLPVPGSQLSVYYITLVTLAVVALAARSLRHSLPGRVMIAVRDDERASAAYGISPAVVKLTTIAVSGAAAGIAGVLWAEAWRSVHPDQFPAALSLSLLAVPVVGGLGSIGGAIAAAVAIYFPAQFLTPHLSGLLGSFAASAGFTSGLSGFGMVFILLQHPTGIAGTVQTAWQRFVDRLAEQVSQRPQTAEPTFALEARDVLVRFGGVKALDGASIDVGAGEIVGLIGPNGAGKSTLLDVISGVRRPAAGSVVLQGRNVSDLPPEIRAGLGLGRTFQAARLFPGLTVLDTVQASLVSHTKIGVVAAMARLPWARRAEHATRAQAAQIVERMGLTPWADTLTGDLSTGTRRICTLATELAARPKVLLLDEPTAGVAQRETEMFGPLLRRIRDELGCAIVIVEHDMPLLMGLCDRVYAMEAGQVIAEGTPQRIRHDPRVIASYLGTDETAISRSGRTLPTKRTRPRPLRPTQAPSSNGHTRTTTTVPAGALQKDSLS